MPLSKDYVREVFEKGLVPYPNGVLKPDLPYLIDRVQSATEADEDRNMSAVVFRLTCKNDGQFRKLWPRKSYRPTARPGRNCTRPC